MSSVGADTPTKLHVRVDYYLAMVLYAIVYIHGGIIKASCCLVPDEFVGGGISYSGTGTAGERHVRLVSLPPLLRIYQAAYIAKRPGPVGARPPLRCVCSSTPVT